MIGEDSVMKTEYKINEVSIKRPHDFKTERYRITKAERVASGKMMMDHIAHKKKFFFTYKAIKASDLNKILAIVYESTECFFKFDYVENNEWKTATCYVGDIPAQLHRSDDADWVWRDVTMNFIEQ